MVSDVQNALLWLLLEGPKPQWLDVQVMHMHHRHPCVYCHVQYSHLCVLIVHVGHDLMVDH